MKNSMRPWGFSVSFVLMFLLTGLSVFALSGCEEGEMPEDQEISEEEVFELIEETEAVNLTGAVRGSCNVVDASSTCLDYIGSFWTEQQMELNCEGAGTYNTTTCPYSELGGCKTTAGAITETIVWSYSYGGSPLTEEEAGYAAAACNSLPMAEWVFPEF